MITNFPKGLLWEIQSQREHRDRLTLIMFRSLKCSKSQTWLHIYEAKMHLLFILGRSLNFETLCSRPRQLWNHRKFVPCCSKRFPPFPWTVSTMEQTVHFTTGCCCESVTVSKSTWQGTLLEGEKIISTEVTVACVLSWCNDPRLLSVISLVDINQMDLNQTNCYKKKKKERSTVDSVKDSEAAVPAWQFTTVASGLLFCCSIKGDKETNTPRKINLILAGWNLLFLNEVQNIPIFLCSAREYWCLILVQQNQFFTQQRGYPPKKTKQKTTLIRKKKKKKKF